MKPIIICADDYGQSLEISQAIINLLNAGRLTAVSCLTTLPNWPLYGSWLKPYTDKADIGLHFNLTLDQPLSQHLAIAPHNRFPRLLTILIRSHIRHLNLLEITAELNQQIDQFISVIGKPPAFIDGHEHIHHLPVVRDAVLQTFKTRSDLKMTYLRSVHLSKLSQILGEPAKLKRLIIELTGGKQFHSKLRKLKLRSNTSFHGIYDFAYSKNYSNFFKRFLTHIQPYGMIMCHPGLSSQDSNDAIRVARFDEYEYFVSEQFLQDCHEFNIQIGRFSV